VAGGVSEQTDVTEQFGESVRRLRLELHRQYATQDDLARLGLEPIDPDRLDGDLQDLVVRVHEARDLRGRLFSPQQRAEHQKIVDDFGALEKTAGEHHRAAVAASRTLATVVVGGARQRRTAASYRRRRRQGAQAHDIVAVERPRAELAKSALAEDERRQQQHRGHPGTNAGAALAEHLRARIDEAVRVGALFPAWFTITELGHQPPAGRAAQWREAATSLLLYRLTYRVTDPTVALGPEPEQSDPSRVEWHTRLVQSLRELA
jgi:hypothetical protein